MAQSVKLAQSSGAIEVPASDVSSNDSLVKAKFVFPSGIPRGVYDVVVTNSDGSVAKLPGAFTV